MNAEIGIIGGTGVYDQSAFENIKEISVDTPFGKPSSEIILGEFEGKKVAFLPRHGKGHVFSPTNVPYRANIYAMKKLGVHTILSIAAVGSLKEEIEPLDIVVPDQIYDRTKHRISTFFEDIVVHIGFANPFCKRTSRLICETARKLNFKVHEGGTYVCIEGPQFSTKAESQVYRALGFDIIGMTALPEAKLAREAEICYATIATVTDYDVWKESEVDVATVLEYMAKNEEKVKTLLREIIPKIEGDDSCECRNSLRYAITTSPDKINEEAKEKLGIFIGRYL
ncbi:methylthioadenosine phosphorylase [Archaeoglobus sulfaticallidus PM70-1]|uniref:S-methyl-5'-thioadenosine phosphorylase n=1 Tax=Archaeoglobus sulfaticallidus PM70-1 TaxID=387631 RepID=N0BE15_9EURY|nr:S-methyl-5'-thioadenosine phosphorylase [Archaeoglobus sulfaticallidus]AGK60462.1 methylthioadenosine phosphorylase [Archaeoglobus sulfaticallidus PM70-1]